MLDLDNFKKFNDTYGHDAGDMLLRKLGELLNNHLRQSDLKCRYGGEEFVIVLIDSPLKEARQRLEKIRETVKAMEIQHGKDIIGGVTLSMGLVEAHDCDWTTNRLLQAADEALYAAKRAGRDRIEVYAAAD
jgi:diguanylate cyclase (GGDEF)-like protein